MERLKQAGVVQVLADYRRASWAPMRIAESDGDLAFTRDGLVRLEC